MTLQPNDQFDIPRQSAFIGVASEQAPNLPGLNTEHSALTTSQSYFVAARPPSVKNVFTKFNKRNVQTQTLRLMWFRISKYLK